jgi:hypothetical protein
MAGPSECACIIDIEIERELYVDPEEEISVDGEYDNLR